MRRTTLAIVRRGLVSRSAGRTAADCAMLPGAVENSDLATEASPWTQMDLRRLAMRLFARAICLVSQLLRSDNGVDFGDSRSTENVLFARGDFCGGGATFAQIRSRAR